MEYRERENFSKAATLMERQRDRDRRTGTKTKRDQQENLS